MSVSSDDGKNNPHIHIIAVQSIVILGPEVSEILYKDYVFNLLTNSNTILYNRVVDNVLSKFYVPVI